MGGRGHCHMRWTWGGRSPAPPGGVFLSNGGALRGRAGGSFLMEWLWERLPRHAGEARERAPAPGLRGAPGAFF